MLGLVSLQNSYIDLGIRQISACCRQAGIPTQVLWLNREADQPLSQQHLNSVIEWLRQTECIAVGLNVMSVHLSLAKQLTEIVKTHLEIPVIWGGAHAILKPEECVEYADYVCVGEGEESIVYLMQAIRDRRIPDTLDNFWYSSNGMVHRNRREIVRDLNSLPVPDNSLRHHWVLDDSRVVPATASHLAAGFPWNAGRHIILSGRGCPYRCTYCCSDALKDLLGPHWANRHRSVNHLMTEIRDVLETTPEVHTIAIMDDTFFFKPPGWIEQFCDEFKTTGASFGVLLHPKSVTHESIDMLIDAGLIGIQMGLQSGSERISRKVFNRVETVEDFKKAAAVLDAFTGRLHSRTYDVIVDNPFETDEDRIETIRVLMSLKKPFNIDVFSLTLYPGTRLRTQCLKSGTDLSDPMFSENKNFLQYKPTVLNRLTRLTHSNPTRLIDFMLRHYKTSWGKWLIISYDQICEKGIRVILRYTKRGLLHSLNTLTSAFAPSRRIN